LGKMKHTHLRVRPIGGRAIGGGNVGAWTVRAAFLIGWLGLPACAPKIVHIDPSEGAPGTVVSLAMEYLVGWPRVEIGGQVMDYPRLKLMGLKPDRRDVPGEELVWIEDKILQFRVPDLPPGEYKVTVHDDKGPPGDLVYSFLETTAYLIFPPVWPFVLRSNQTQVNFRVTAK
jgi:hypothetical protein